jgi:hypothetical protein
LVRIYVRDKKPPRDIKICDEFMKIVKESTEAELDHVPSLKRNNK